MIFKNNSLLIFRERERNFLLLLFCFNMSISSSLLKNIFVVYRIPGWKFVSFSILNYIICYSILWLPLLLLWNYLLMWIQQKIPFTLCCIFLWKSNQHMLNLLIHSILKFLNLFLCSSFSLGCILPIPLAYFPIYSFYFLFSFYKTYISNYSNQRQM